GHQLPDAVPVGQYRGILAPLAHQPVDLAARLPLHPSGRQPAWRMEDESQPAHHDDPRRPVAWGQMADGNVGLSDWRLAGGPSADDEGPGAVPHISGRAPDPAGLGPAR